MKGSRTLPTGERLEVLECRTCGYAHLHPKPSQESQEALYEHFWEKEVPRGFEYMKADRAWKRRQWKVLMGWAEELLDHPLSLLDIGCGDGGFLEYVSRRAGWLATGMDPDPKAREITQQKLLPCLSDIPTGFKVNCVTMLEVLEHVMDPSELVFRARDLLYENGVLILAVPNDFSALQLRMDTFERRWWIHRHHVNYFDWQSIERLLSVHGFEIVRRSTTFPMEVFLPVANYVEKPSLGRKVHGIRKILDSLGLDRIYPYLASKGMGRHIVLAARKLELPSK